MGMDADFSHDNEMAAIYAAVGLLRQGGDLDVGRMDGGRTWFASRMVRRGWWLRSACGGVCEMKKGFVSLGRLWKVSAMRGILHNSQYVLK